MLVVKGRCGTLRCIGIVVFTFFLTGAVYAEHVFLKNGRIMQGKIVLDAKTGVTVVSRDNVTTVIPRDTILRILYTDEYTNKSVIQLAGGETFEGFIVNETRQNISIRKKLDDPEEMVIAKDQIARTEKKRPSKLTGRVTDRGIHLTWTKPLGSIKTFIVYMKKKDGEYRAFDNVNNTGMLVTNTEPDTPYQFQVRIVDSDNYESLPSNEITVRTLKTGEKAPEFKGVAVPQKAIGSTAATEVKKGLSMGIGFFGTGGVSMQFWNGKTGNTGNAGGGFVLDTAVARNTLYNYRFTLSCENDYGFRYLDRGVVVPFDVNIPPVTRFYMTTYYKSKQLINPVSISFSHAFGFGVFRTSLVRLWLGPELAFRISIKGAENLIGGAAGLGLTIGLNLNFGELVTLSITESTRVLYAVQSSHYKTLKVKTFDMSVIGLPNVPNITRKVKSLEKGFQFGGQFNLAVIFRINDRY